MPLCLSVNKGGVVVIGTAHQSKTLFAFLLNWTE